MAQEVINQFKEKTGSDLFDKKVVSEGKPKKKTKKEGTRARPFNVGLFQEVTDISWPSGTFLLVGTQDLTEIEFDSNNNPVSVTRFKGIAAVSEDGIEWVEINTDAVSEGITVGPDGGDTGGPTASLFAGISDGSRELGFYMAAGFYRVHTPTASGYLSPSNFPAVWSSADQGASWEDTGLPSFAPESMNFSNIPAIGYSPKTKLFYVTVAYTTFGGDHQYFHYAGSGDGGWGEIGSGSTLDLPYPENTRTTGSVTSSKIKYAQISAPGQKMTFADSDGEQHTLSMVGNDLAIDGVSLGVPVASFSSATVGRGHIIALGFDDNGFEQYLHRSIDEGVWENIPQLQGFTVSPPIGGPNIYASVVAFA